MTPAADPLDLGPPGPVLGVRAFRCGDWNDQPSTPADVAALAANYAAFAAGSPPYYLPFVSLNHADGLAFGRVSRCEAVGEFLDVDLADVPLVVRRWMKGDRLTAPSIEFWDPGRFVGPNKTKWPTPVLKCVTLLGNDAPGAKGLPPLSAATYPGLDDGPDTATILPSALTPAALTKYRPTAGVSKFSDHAPATRSGGRRMNPERQKLLDGLKAAGVPVDSVTEATPDSFLQGVLGTIQKAAQNPPPLPVDGDKDKGGKPAEAETGVQKYRDQMGREQSVTVPAALLPMAQGFAALMEQMHANNAAAVAARTREAVDARKAKVRAFRDEMTTPDKAGNARMTPAQFDELEPMLVGCDDSGVRKFRDGKTEGTELDERMAGIRSSFAEPVRKFRDAMPGGKLNVAEDAPKPVRNPAVPPKASDISPEVRAMIESAGFGHQLQNLAQ